MRVIGIIVVSVAIGLISMLIAFALGAEEFTCGLICGVAMILTQWCISDISKPDYE